MEDLFVTLKGCRSDVERAEKIRDLAVINLFKVKSDRASVLNLMTKINNKDEASWWIQNNYVCTSVREFILALNRID